MGRHLAASNAAADRTWDVAAAATGVDVRSLCWDSDRGTLTRTENAQIALTVTSLAALAAYTVDGSVPPSAFAGHSVGALAAACGAGYLSTEAAARLALERGRIMADLPGHGSMLAVAVPRTGDATSQAAEGRLLAGRFGLDLAAVNGPGQVVLSGPADKVKEAGDTLGARAQELTVSHAFHSTMMGPGEPDWTRLLDDTGFAETGHAYLRCTDGRVVNSGAEVRDDLAGGLCRPVMWAAVLASAQGYGSVVVFGPGQAIVRLARPYFKGDAVSLVGDRY